MKKGKFIVLEGQGFSGKTEQSHLLVKNLKEHGVEVIETQEPGGVEEAIAIRDELLKRRSEKNITPEEELELFYKSRKIFLEKKVLPALKEGVWVVSTRFSASTFVYQGREGGVSMNKINELESKVVGKNQPDLYILLDVSSDEVVRRLKESNREKHGYNEMDETLIKSRREYYLELAKEDKYGNWVVVSGDGTVNEVSQRIWQVISARFNL